jgi:sugar/nucleoside kinase (ribokinase family)
MPDFVIAGHVTRDLIVRDDSAPEERLGGAASYCSQTAARLGVDVELVTTAPADFGLLDDVRNDPHITVREQVSTSVTTFGLDYRAGVRTVRLLERAPSVTKPTLGPTRLAYLGPVIGELSEEAFDWFPGAQLTVGLQGFMRETDANGLIRAKEPPALEVLAKAHTVVFSEHDHPKAEALARHIASRVPVVVLTRGARGATLFDHGYPELVAPVPAIERDPTGAGDVFAAALAVWLGRDATPMDAAAQAAYCAARAVEGAGLGNL